jgi:hypothetical protein
VFGALSFGLALVLVLGWAALTWRQGPFTLLLETGEVCFAPAEPGYTVSVDPGCYSGACTLAVRQGGTVTVDEAQATINVSATFLLRRLDFPRGSRECSADCDGPPPLRLSLDPLPARDFYTVRLGGRWVGELALPVTGEVCFDDRAPFPTPMGAASGNASPAGAQYTPAPPTRTPAAYPAPESTGPAATPAGPYP